MPALFTSEQAVEVIQPVIRGKIISKAIVNDELQYLVEYPGEDGEMHRRFFLEQQLQAVTQS